MSIKESRLLKDKKGTRIVVRKEDESPFMLKESQWIPDSRSLNCSNCQLRFTTIRRRHHCRRCGHCFCDSCCRSYPLIRMAFVDAVLQCYKCIEKSKYELDLFKFAFPCLEAGADLYVENYDCIFFAKLTANQRTVILTDPQNSLHTETIQVTAIQSFRETCVSDQCSLLDLLAVEVEFEGCAVLGRRTLTLVAVSGHQRFISQSWLRNLLKMDVEHSKALRTGFFEICMRLQSNELLCDFLLSRGVIDDSVRETITRHNTLFMKNYELMRVVETKDNFAFESFKRGLEELQEQHLLTYLEASS